MHAKLRRRARARDSTTREFSMSASAAARMGQIPSWRTFLGRRRAVRICAGPYLNSRNSRIVVNARYCARRNECKISCASMLQKKRVFNEPSWPCLSRPSTSLPGDAASRVQSAPPSLRFVDNAHMRGDHAPAFGKTHPGLHLTADFSGHAGAVKQRRGHGGVAAIRRDHRARNGA
jgi:hypothetical protein